MKKSLVLCTAVLGAASLLSSCKPSQPTVAEKPATPSPTAVPSATPVASVAPADASGLKDPVATVNGEPITRAALQEAFNNAVQASGVKVADLNETQKLEGYHQLLDELILDKLITKASAGIVVTQADIDAEIAKIKSQFPSEEEFNKQLAAAGQTPDKINESLKKMLQQQKWIESQIGNKIVVTDADAKTFYDGNQSEFQEGASVKASHILFKVDKDAPESVNQAQLAAAKKAVARAKKEDFAKLAKELSQEPGADKTGGDLGFFTKDRMVPEFAEVAFAQKVGTVSQPVKTQFGWHVIKVTDTKPARQVPFDEVKEQVVTYLKQDKQRAAVQELVKGLRSQAKVDSTLPEPPPAPPVDPAAAAVPGAPGADTINAPSLAAPAAPTVETSAPSAAPAPAPAAK